MSLGVSILLFLVCLVFSASFSGSETGVYSLSRVRLDSEAREGRPLAIVLRRLLRDDRSLLITLLIGNNLMLELATHVARSQVAQRSPGPDWTIELWIAVLLTPAIFLFGELLPKDLFRRRPHRFLGICAPVLVAARIAFLPLSIPLGLLSSLLERLGGLSAGDFARALGREEVRELLREGTRLGALEPRAEELAQNVLVLRETPVSLAMIAWDAVRAVDLDQPAKVGTIIDESEWSRLPVIRRIDGTRRVVGYLHVIDVLAQDRPLDELVRPLPAFEPELAVDRALARLRVTGKRLALVGTPERPVGLVTLMDLLACISGDAPV